MTTKDIRESVEFIELLTITLNDTNKKTLEKWLKMASSISYKDGFADGLAEARRMITEESK